MVKLSEVKIGMEIDGSKVVKIVKEPAVAGDLNKGFRYTAKLANGSWIIPEQPKKAVA